MRFPWKSGHSRMTPASVRLEVIDEQVECEMSGRRSSNSRWLVWGIAVTIGSLVAAGVGLAPAYSTVASSTVLAVEAPRLGSAVSPSAPASLDQSPQTRGDNPRPKIKPKGPQFVVQPRLVGRNLLFTVKVNPYRTARKNRLAKRDLLNGKVDVSRRGVAIRKVGLAPETRAKKLIFTVKLKKRVVKRSGRIQYQIRLPKAVARSLAATSVRNRTTRVRVVLVQAKDTDRRMRVRQTLALAQSSLDPLPTARSRAATDRLRTALRSSNVQQPMTLNNYTPFTLQASTQATQCVDAPQWSGTLYPGNVVEQTADILYSGSPSGESLWQELSQDAVTALLPAAKAAAQTAVSQGAASFSPEGAIIVASSFAKTFVIDFIKAALVRPSCSDTPGTWVTSAVATGLPLPLYQGYYGGGSWASNGTGWPGQSGPAQTVAQLASTLGAQTSVQWNWNGGKPAANGPGASYFSGGLIQTSTNAGSGGLFTNIYYQNNASYTYGPIQDSNITLTVTSGTDPDEPGALAVNLACNTGTWSLLSPWGTGGYSLSNPPNPPNQGNVVTSFYYNGVDGSGNPVTGQQLNPAIWSTSTGYLDNVPTSIWIDQSVINTIISNNGGGSITSWGCSVQAETQVPAFQTPAGWVGNSGTSNLGWYSEPMTATAPNPL